MSGDDLFGETSPLLEDGHVLANTQVPDHTVDNGDQEEGQVNRVFLAVAMIGEMVMVSIHEDA